MVAGMSRTTASTSVAPVAGMIYRCIDEEANITKSQLPTQQARSQRITRR